MTVDARIVGQHRPRHPRADRRGARRRRAQGERLLERVLTYRIFEDDAGRMNLSLADIGGGLLLVPQFTLAADTHKGTRAGFSSAEHPERARALFEELVATGASAPRRGRHAANSARTCRCRW